MINMSIINSPPHYVEGRRIEPINVIEAWSLSHHLACVVKYIARAGRKNPILEDLKKAEWYLDRVVSRELSCPEDGITQQQEPHVISSAYLPQGICDDWRLSGPLCSVLINLFLYQERSSRLLKEKALRSALECLREEIKIHAHGQG